MMVSSADCEAFVGFGMFVFFYDLIIKLLTRYKAFHNISR